MNDDIHKMTPTPSPTLRDLGVNAWNGWLEEAATMAAFNRDDFDMYASPLYCELCLRFLQGVVEPDSEAATLLVAFAEKFLVQEDAWRQLCHAWIVFGSKQRPANTA